MDHVAIGGRLVGDVLVLSVPDLTGAAGPDLLAESLTAAVVPAARLVVLDLRAAGMVSVHTGRALVLFARGCADRGVECALVPDPADKAASAVLDLVDPSGVVPRFGTLG
ncbi:hypothetical protein [Lentzea sp.]|uniref:hypothetical protein n=1 Tax=Lentzea sp. TaxID=56099 RepID=UPI002ED0E0E5